MLALVRLLQLASPVLPVGAYTYSQGLEQAVETGVVADQATALAWIGGILEECCGRFEAPLTASLQQAWQRAEPEEIRRLNAEFIASRESRELRAETLQMGYSLRRLLLDLGDFEVPAACRTMSEIAYPTVWALAAANWRIAPADSVAAYLWSWCENQVLAAVKTVPLGQSAGQRLLLALGSRLPVVVQRALVLPEAEWSNFAPGFALASMTHETQYARLFRS